jgi:hypothetical protein
LFHKNYAPKIAKTTIFDGAEWGVTGGKTNP